MTAICTDTLLKKYEISIVVCGAKYFLLRQKARQFNNHNGNMNLRKNQTKNNETTKISREDILKLRRQDTPSLRSSVSAPLRGREKAKAATQLRGLCCCYGMKDCFLLTPHSFSLHGEVFGEPAVPSVFLVKPEVAVFDLSLDV